MFVSKECVDKAWPKHECHHALSRMIEECHEYILPVQFDDTEVSGLPRDVLYLNANEYTPKALAEAIVKKLKIYKSTDTAQDLRETYPIDCYDLIYSQNKNMPLLWVRKYFCSRSQYCKRTCLGVRCMHVHYKRIRIRIRQSMPQMSKESIRRSNESKW